MYAHSGRRGIAPSILNLGTRWSTVVEIYILVTLLLQKTLQAPTEWRVGGWAHSQYGHSGEEKNLFPKQGIKPWINQPITKILQKPH
jgi:hypothetical protein